MLDKGAVAEKFNSFNTTVASKFIEKLTKSVNKVERQFVQLSSSVKVTPNSFSFSMVSENKILKYVVP